MNAEQEAIERLRAELQRSGCSCESCIRRRAYLRALLDSHERMRAALEETEAAYLAFRRGIRSAIAPVHMSNPLVSDEWIIDRVNELRAALEGGKP